MKVKTNDCTIIVSSCDAYSDIWDAFFTLFKKYWPDCPYKIVLNTETLQYSYPDLDIDVINAPRAEMSWTARLKNVVEQVDSEQILFLLDDFFFYDYVDTRRVGQCAQWLKENPKVASFTFWPAFLGSIACEFPGFEQSAPNSYVTVAAITSLWNKQRLLLYLSENENPWEWEFGATKRSRHTEDRFLFMEPGLRKIIIPYDFNNYGLIGGRWAVDTEHLFKINDIEIDFSKRGFFDKKLIGLAPSFSLRLELDSSIVPFYDLTHEDTPYLSYNTITANSGPFKQTYSIPGAKKMIQWNPTKYGFRYGYGVAKFLATVHFYDGTSEVIDTKTTFGNYVFLNDMMVFARYSPKVFIPVKNDILIDSLEIEGIFVKPLSEDTLLQADELDYIPTPEDQQKYVDGIWREILASPSLSSHRPIIKPCLIYSPQIETEVRYDSGPFSITYLLDFRCGSTLLCKLSDQNWFSIENLSVEVMYSDGYTRRIGFSSVNNSFKHVKNHIVFSGNTAEISIMLPMERPEKLVVSGIIHTTIPHKILRAFIYGDYEQRQLSQEEAMTEHTKVYDNSWQKRAARGIKKYGAFGVVKEIFKRIVKG